MKTAWKSVSSMTGILEQQDLLLFEAGGKLFSLPANCVLKAFFPLAVTPLPFANDRFDGQIVDGLINVDGDIAVQINFFRLCGLETRAPEPELILLDTGRCLCAITVDRILERVTADDENQRHPDAEPVEPQWIAQQVHASKIIRDGTGWMGKVAQHREPPALDTDSYIAVVKAVAAVKAARLAAEEASKDPGYLQVRIGGCAYLIPIVQVKKIIPFCPPQTLADPHGKIRGAIDSGNRIIPLLALESSLGLHTLAAEGEYVILGNSVVGNSDKEWAIGVDSADSIHRIADGQVNRQALPVLDFSYLW